MPGSQVHCWMAIASSNATKVWLRRGECCSMIPKYGPNRGVLCSATGNDSRDVGSWQPRNMHQVLWWWRANAKQTCDQSLCIVAGHAQRDGKHAAGQRRGARGRHNSRNDDTPQLHSDLLYFTLHTYMRCHHDCALASHSDRSPPQACAQACSTTAQASALPHVSPAVSRYEHR